MPVLESRLVIGAVDETGGAFAKIKEKIAGFDKQIGTFDKMMAATRKVAGANDGMITSIDRSAKAFMEEKEAMEGLSRVMASGTASAEEMANAQGRLAAWVSKANRALAMQGEETERTSRKIKRARESVPKGAGGGGMMAGAAAMAGFLVPFEAYEGGKKALEASADLEQQKVRVREVSHTDPTESSFAEQLAAEVATKYPAITQAKALDTYLELRGNAANQNGGINQETARRNLMTVSQAQVAALAVGTEITPEDAQNLLKAVEGSGRAGDPTAVPKMFDSYIRAKQVFGSAIDSSKVRDYVQNAKGANFGIGEDQFFWQNIVRMTEGNASRLGNETAQTLQTLVGGHATKQTARWLVDMGLATGFTPQGGGAATVQGLKGSDTLQVNQLDWANQVLLPALQAHGVLSEENIAKREALLRKDNPNIDERTLKERAESGLISAAIAGSGMRTTVTDNLAHAIANELLIGRDVQQMKGASGMAAAADIGQNPVAAMKELTGAITNFGAVLASPMMGDAARSLDSLARSIAGFTEGVNKENKAQAEGLPSPAGEDERRRMNRLVFGEDTNEGGLDVLKRKLGWGPSDGTPPAAAMPEEHHWGPWHAGGTPSGPIVPSLGRDPRSPQSGPYSYTPKGSEAISVSGQAELQQSLNVTITLDPEIRAMIASSRQSASVTIPLIGGGAGRMDSDAGPTRSGGVGSM
jgi:hypothetical protein